MSRGLSPAGLWCSSPIRRWSSQRWWPYGLKSTLVELCPYRWARRQFTQHTTNLFPFVKVKPYDSGNIFLSVCMSVYLSLSLCLSQCVCVCFRGQHTPVLVFLQSWRMKVSQTKKLFLNEKKTKKPAKTNKHAIRVLFTHLIIWIIQVGHHRESQNRFSKEDKLSVIIRKSIVTSKKEHLKRSNRKHICLNSKLKLSHNLLQNKGCLSSFILHY